MGGADSNRIMRHLWPYLTALTAGVLMIAAVLWLGSGSSASADQRLLVNLAPYSFDIKA